MTASGRCGLCNEITGYYDYGPPETGWRCVPLCRVKPELAVVDAPDGTVITREQLLRLMEARPLSGPMVLPLAWKDPSHEMHETIKPMVDAGNALFNELIPPAIEPETAVPGMNRHERRKARARARR